jgi:hypothetical protein
MQVFATVFYGISLVTGSEGKTVAVIVCEMHGLPDFEHLEPLGQYDTNVSPAGRTDGRKCLENGQ